MAGKPLSKQMPDVWSIFFKQRNPRLLQKQAMPLLIQGKSVLLSGPTASGKTEAALTPLLQRHISFQRKQVSVVYIAPTKALVNDIFYRLDSYLCARMPGAICRHTGDHHDFKDPAGLFLLIATPEGLDSLQLTKPETLTGIRAIIIDEIHMLHGNARGQQLRHVISRIEQNAAKPQHPKDVFQKIGMTATLQDMEGVCNLWLGKKARIVKAGDPRQIDITYLPVEITEGLAKAAGAAQVIADWFEETGTKKGLIFGNTRNNTQVLAATLYEILQGSRWPVHWHTGIITASERERVEEAMKNERFGICVATATLEVGIDIGDLDIIILLDPPYSINAFLQRIGRGNRQTDICKVIVLYSTEQELNLFKALHHCASIGTLDEIHEYDRAAVRFQQIVSFAWLGAEQDKPLTRRNLAARTCDPNHGLVVEDMLETGALEEIQCALLLSQELTDQAEKRQIHTTITGAAILNMVDSSSGETIISASGQGITEGSLFIGGKIKNVTANVDGSVSLEATRGKRYPLSSLPASRGKRGLGRKIIWALAELSEEDPRTWQQEGSRLITWAGADYNRLLTIILKIEGITSHAQPDEYGIDGVPDGAEISPPKILEWVESIRGIENLPTKDISPFCDRSRYFSQLSSAMQETEIQRSVPFPGFENWLHECKRDVACNVFVKDQDDRKSAELASTANDSSPSLSRRQESVKVSGEMHGAPTSTNSLTMKQVNLFLNTRKLTSSKEDHLTEFLAAIITMDELFNRQFSELVLGKYSKQQGWEQPRIAIVETQVSYRGTNCCPDMRFTLEDGHVILCENKIEATETQGSKSDFRGQLRRYLDLPAEGLIYIRATPSHSIESEVSNHPRFVTHNGHHFLWRDFYPLLENNENPLVAAVCKGFEVMGFVPPLPIIGALSDFNSTENEKNRIAFKEYWQSAADYGRQLGWKVETNKNAEMYYDRVDSDIIYQVFCSPSKFERFLIRLTLQQDVDYRQIREKLLQATTSVPYEIVDYERKITRKNQKGTERVVDITSSLRNILGDTQDKRKIQQRLLYFVQCFIEDIR